MCGMCGALQMQLYNANACISTLQSQLADLQTQLGYGSNQMSSLQTQLAAANTRANDLQRQLDDCRKAKKSLEDEVAQLKTDKVKLQTIINTLQAKMGQKDLDTLKYQSEKLKAENRIQTQLEPYITTLINIMNANGFTDYPPRP